VSLRDLLPGRRRHDELTGPPAAAVADELEPGTLKAFDAFSRCADCARVYWRGAHADQLDAVVTGAGG
jgi:uncharacterized protein with PIN domain